MVQKKIYKGILKYNMKGVAMSEYSINTSINLPYSTRMKIDKLAKDTGRTKSNLIAFIIEEYLKKEGK
jgi:macrodomain Ter protein organizer (MatP/YcbG family)